MGPGTHIVRKVQEEIMPVNHEDALALIHDLRYLGATRIEQLDWADDQAIQSARWYTKTGLAMKAGLVARKALSIDKTGKRPAEARYLLEIVQNNPRYRQRFAELGVSIPKRLLG